MEPPIGFFVALLGGAVCCSCWFLLPSWGHLSLCPGQDLRVDRWGRRMQIEIMAHACNHDDLEMCGLTEVRGLFPTHRFGRRAIDGMQAVQRVQLPDDFEHG